MKNPWKIVSYIFVAVIAVVVLLLVVSVIPIPGNYKVLMVLSGSMEPVIKVGSIVTVKPRQEYKIDDIITFNSGSKAPTTHRIVDIEEESDKILYMVKGDANEDPDLEKVPKENVIGKVLFSIPFLGYALDFAKKPVGFVILIWVPAIIVIWEEIGNIRKELKKESKTPIVQTVENSPGPSKLKLDIQPKEKIIKSKKLDVIKKPSRRKSKSVKKI